MSDALPPQTREDVAAMLSATIGEDVFNRMEQVGWQPTTDAPPTVAPVANPQAPTSTPAAPVATPANPVPAAVPAAAPTDIDWESYRDSNGLILGKYKDKADAIRGYHSILHLAKNALSQRDEALGRLTQAQQQQYANPIPPVVAPTARPTGSRPAGTLPPVFDEVLSKINDNNGVMDPEDLKRLFVAQQQQIREDIEREQREQQAAIDERNQKWLAVDAHMLQHHPEAMTYADQMGVWTETQPEVKAVKEALLRAGNYLEASVYVWEKFQTTLPALDPAKVAEQERVLAAGQVRQEAVEAARRDAGLVGSSAGGVHPTPPAAQQTTQEQINEAARYMQQTGDGSAWRHHVIGRTLSGPLFDGP